MPESDVSDSLMVQGKAMRAAAMRCRVHVLWVIVPFLLLLSLQAGQFAWVITKLETSEPKPYMTAVINVNGTQRCGRTDTASTHPCIHNQLYFTSDEPIGPLICFDDAFAVTGSGPDNCHGNPFRIATDGKGVVIPRAGIYRVVVKVTYFDRESHHTTLSVRVDPPHQAECLGNHACLEDRENRAHAWLSCHSHQPPAAAKGSPDFANCLVDGIRRFSAGDTVGMQVAIGYRNISSHYKATYMYIHQL